MKFEFVAVDFDGTLCADAFPEIGEPRPLVIEYVKALAAHGSKIILHTSRENGTRRLLDEAVEFCKAQGIPLFAVNENPGNTYAEAIGPTYKDNRKVYANLYIDDKAVHPDEIEDFMLEERADRRRDRRRGQARRVLRVLKYAVLTVAGILAFAGAYATRGGGAPGGEILFPLLPVAWYAAERTARDVIADVKNGFKPNF